MTASDKPSPLFERHFDGLRKGRVQFPVCESCDTVNWYPLLLCRKCQSDSFRWTAVSGPARLWSWTVVRRPFAAQWVGKVPYVVGLVEFDALPGTRLISNIVDCTPEELHVNASLEAVFASDDHGAPLVYFRPIGTTPGTANR